MLAHLFSSLLTAVAASSLVNAQSCTRDSSDLFNLQAVYTTPPASGSSTVHLQVQTIWTGPDHSWAVLTAGTSPGLAAEYMDNYVLKGYIDSNPVKQRTNIGIRLLVGETPTFQSVFEEPYPPNSALAGYCLVDTASTTLLSVAFHADQWALCSNSTAGGRVDVVYSPVASHPHYNIANCSAVTIELTLEGV